MSYVTDDEQKHFLLLEICDILQFGDIQDFRARFLRTVKELGFYQPGEQATYDYLHEEYIHNELANVRRQNIVIEKKLKYGLGD